MRLKIEAILDYAFEQPTDVLLSVEVAPIAEQRLIEDRLTVVGAGPLRPIPGEDGIGRRTWLRAEGNLVATYRATVDVERTLPPVAGIGIAERLALPATVIPYLWPSRYCEADRFESFVQREFDDMEGGDKVAAIVDWVQNHLDYVSGSSDGTTTAADTFVSRKGVCRDYAHLTTTLARAAGIPARVVSAYAWQLDPPDFHAVVEVFLADGWHIVDATGLAPIEGLAILGVGRDATDIAFMTTFGAAMLNEQRVSVQRID